MKSFYGFLILTLISITFFTGMLVVADNLGNNDILNDDSNTLIESLDTKLNNVTGGEDISNLDVDAVSIGTQDVDAFSAEFYSATTDGNKKQSTLQQMKNIPDLVRYSVGNDEDFKWFWDIGIWFIGVMVVLVGFVIIFKRDIFGGNQ